MVLSNHWFSIQCTLFLSILDPTWPRMMLCPELCVSPDDQVLSTSDTIKVSIPFHLGCGRSHSEAHSHSTFSTTYMTLNSASKAEWGRDYTCSSPAVLL